MDITQNKIRFKEGVKELLHKIEQQEFSNEYIDILRKVYFLYNKQIREKMISEKHWDIIGNIDEAKSKKDEYTKKAKSYSSYRYEKDYGWLGVYAQDKVKAFFKNLELHVEEWKEDLRKREDKKDWKSKVDRYDLKINNKTFDVKCATQPHYIEMTAKVTVEKEIKKDFYIATKFFDDDKLYLIGFFKHDDIIGYPKNKLYGAEYYKVPLYEAKCLEDLPILKDFKIK